MHQNCKVHFTPLAGLGWENPNPSKAVRSRSMILLRFFASTNVIGGEGGIENP